MRSSFIVASLAAIWSGVAVADTLVFLDQSLVKRQESGAYRPSSTYGRGTCEANGQVTCSRTGGFSRCYLPSRGDTCCSEGYACPGSDFCLTQGYCCRAGYSVEECARLNSVSVPADFKTAGVSPLGAATSAAASPTPAVTTSADDESSTTYDDFESSTTFSAPARPTTTRANNATLSPSTPIVPFTGAANVLDVAAGGVVAVVVVGFVGVLGNVL